MIMSGLDCTWSLGHFCARFLRGAMEILSVSVQFCRISPKERTLGQLGISYHLKSSYDRRRYQQPVDT